MPSKTVLGLSWPHLGCFSAAFGRSQTSLGQLLRASCELLVASGLPWAPPASIWKGLWCLRPGCWRAPMAVFAMVFGHAFGVSPLIVNNAWIAAENSYWHFLGLSFSPCGAAVRALWAHGIAVFAQLGRLLWTLCVSCRITLCYRNPRATSLRPAERHNARGSLPQRG